MNQQHRVMERSTGGRMETMRDDDTEREKHAGKQSVEIHILISSIRSLFETLGHYRQSVQMSTICF